MRVEGGTELGLRAGMKRTPSLRSRRGFSLAEVMAVVVIMGIVAAMAGPAMARWIQTISQRSAANQLVADLSYARAFAAREGRTVSLRVVNPTTYQITVDAANGAVDRQLKRVDLSQMNRATTFSTGSARIAFDSRGLLRNNASTTTQLTVVRGYVSETVTVSQVGRPQRER